MPCRVYKVSLRGSNRVRVRAGACVRVHAPRSPCHGAYRSPHCVRREGNGTTDPKKERPGKEGEGSPGGRLLDIPAEAGFVQGCGEFLGGEVALNLEGFRALGGVEGSHATDRSDGVFDRGDALAAAQMHPRYRG